jgi:hypothetical protein
MTQDKNIEMPPYVNASYEGDDLYSGNQVRELMKLVAEKATAEANARANASWTLMCEKMVAFEREAIIQIIKETLFSNWFQADVIEVIKARGEQA